MKTIQVNTDLLCENCIERITPHLDAVESIEKWDVDILSEGKVLTASGHAPSLSEIRRALGKAGYHTIGMKRVISPCGPVTEFEKAGKH